MQSIQEESQRLEVFLVCLLLLLLLWLQGYCLLLQGYHLLLLLLGQLAQQDLAVQVATVDTAVGLEDSRLLRLVQLLHAGKQLLLLRGRLLLLLHLLVPLLHLVLRVLLLQQLLLLLEVPDTPA